MEGCLSNQRQIKELKKSLNSIKVRRALLEAAAPPELRDRELRSRIAETETQEALVLDLLAEFGVYPDQPREHSYANESG